MKGCTTHIKNVEPWFTPCYKCIYKNREDLCTNQRELTNAVRSE